MFSEDGLILKMVAVEIMKENSKSRRMVAKGSHSSKGGNIHRSLNFEFPDWEGVQCAVLRLLESEEFIDLQSAILKNCLYISMYMSPRAFRRVVSLCRISKAGEFLCKFIWS
jgi:hypothetical protein